ncbi:hypothetical protein LHYA1_G001370 [Lachnellula hyalina]|uniref:Uncharacterized protein n=1 Tax=Lachnellula hyalina TaxID=1316788 RepID=A0A8H8R667_9HELO|nr:uncharacterized protein LHYA1_G001370 [Lachnellula hyalina]TVY29279.1 hypothetical protein LHYA1_G001370 [Lachnellula hyalina]
MTSAESRTRELAPLRGFDAEAQNVYHSDEMEDLERSEPSPMRAFIWTICSATAIYTTKRLMISHVYPLTIAFQSYVVLGVVYIIALRMGSDSSTTTANKARILQGIRKPSGNGSVLSFHCPVMIPAAVAAAASLPMLLEGLLHMPSLPVLVMLFPLTYAAESLVLFTCCSQSRSQSWFPWEALISMGASAVVLYNEYRLMVPGLIWGVLGILFIGLARGCFIIGSERSGSDLAVQAKLKAYHGFISMTLLFGMLFSGISGYFLEHIESIYPTSSGTISLIVVQISSIVGAIFSGTSLLAYSPISFQDSKARFSNIPLHSTEHIVSFLSSILVLLASIYSNQVPVISRIQIAAYLSASFVLAGASGIHGYVVKATDASKELSKSPSSEIRKPTGVFSGLVLLVAVILSSGFISFLASTSVNSVNQSLPSTFDLAYTPERRFDIVVSMYDEDPEIVKGMLEAVKGTAMLKNLKPNVIIYTKDKTADLPKLKESTGANTVEFLENLGREGATYLHHIVHEWDSLAEQTMFIQAHAHNMRELIPRIDDYLVPETGMLSLGFTGVECDCETCGDRWGWEDKYDAIPALYEKVYGDSCSPSAPILLSYKGQFIASARRIRGISKNIYGDLLDMITSKDGWIHNQTYVGGARDGPDNPYFGFTVERVWGLLMQCATDGRVAAKCPSLLSGMGRGGVVGDCQCLDG